jgi:hypothetical protein
MTEQEEFEFRARREREKYAPKEPTIGEKAKALGYGAVTGFVGGPGELEEFGAYTLPEMIGARDKDSPREKVPFSDRSTIFPTVKEAQQVLGKVGIEPPREEVSGYQTAGEIIGGLGTSLPRALRTGVKTILGTPTKTSGAYAKMAEKLGFKLSPAQVRGDVPLPAKGATGWAEKNQKLANELASKGTGKEVSEISPNFVRGRLSDLGSKFNNLYKGKVFNIDTQAVQALDAIRNIEQMLPASAQVSAIKSTAQNIVDNFSRLASRMGSKPNTFGIEGDALQKIRNDLSAAARSTSNRGDAHRIYELIDIIDDSIARNHPQIASELAVLRPQYRNTIILEDLTRRGGIRQGNISLEQLGDMLGAQRSGIRRSGDIDQLGELGRELGLRARWQTTSTASPVASEVGKILGTTLGGAATGLGLRSRGARALQRRYQKEPSAARLATERVLSSAAPGTVVRPLNEGE